MSTSKTWPGGGTGATPTSYSIPDAGELNWANLSSFLQALGDGAQATTFQKFAVRVATASPITVSATTDCIVISKLAVAGAVTVNLPAGANKQVFIIADGTGDAATNNITINRNGSDTIQGATTLVLNANYEAAILVFNSADTDWKVLAKINQSPGAAVPAAGAVYSNGTALLNRALTTGDLAYASASNVLNALPVGTNNALLYAAGGLPAWTSVSAIQFDGTSLGLGAAPAFTTGTGIEITRATVATLRLERTNATASNIEIRANNGQTELDSSTQMLLMTAGAQRVSISSSAATATVGLSGSAGTVNVSDASGNNDIVLRGDSFSTFTNGVQFGTATASTLNAYEEWSGTVTLTDAASYSQTGTMRITRIGRVVECNYATISGSAGGSNTNVRFTFSDSGSNIPTRFAPTTGQITGVIRIESDSVLVASVAQVGTSNITYFASVAASNNAFATTNNKGVAGGSITWQIL